NCAIQGSGEIPEHRLHAKLADGAGKCRGIGYIEGRDQIRPFEAAGEMPVQRGAPRELRVERRKIFKLDLESEIGQPCGGLSGQTRDDFGAVEVRIIEGVAIINLRE